MLPPMTRADRVRCRMDGTRVSHRSVAYLTWSSGNGLVVERRRRLLIGAAGRHSLRENTIGDDDAAATEGRTTVLVVAMLSLHWRLATDTALIGPLPPRVTVGIRRFSANIVGNNGWPCCSRQVAALPAPPSLLRFRNRLLTSSLSRALASKRLFFSFYFISQ